MTTKLWAEKFGPAIETSDPIIRKTVDFVRSALTSNDASHDWNHIERVYRLSVRIAEAEKVERMDCVILAALLHDIDDWKYSGSETDERARTFLESLEVPSETIDFVLRIIKGVGFKEELGDSVRFASIVCIHHENIFFIEIQYLP
jgi:uncharacterized protein